MKVCHFIASRGLGRGEFYVDLANAMSGKCDVALMIPKDSRYLDRVSAEIEVCQYEHKNSRKNPFLLWELRKKFIAMNPDIVHSHFGKATEIFYLLNKWLKFPHVATKHNPRKGKIFDRMDHVIAVSEQVKKTINTSSVQVIHNAITPVTIEARKKRPERFTIVAVGRLDPIKGFDLLLKDLAGLDNDFLLKIIGSGEQAPHLQALIATLGLSGRVELLGYRDDIPHQLSEADLVVVSSKSEGGPVIALEALFYGNMLISTPVGIVPEILPPDFIVEQGGFAEKVTEVIRDYERFVDRFRKLQLERQSDFFLDAIAGKHIQLYREIGINAGRQFQ
ncbi:MAG: glycosyltransferase [Sedimenticola sp.]|nr:glycosyltransferase [Sedimenticola sp.]